MPSENIQAKRDELKSLYFETARLNKKKKQLENELLSSEQSTGNFEKLARKRKGVGNRSLSVTTASLLIGCSRDRIYRLLECDLPDLHPISIGQFIRRSMSPRQPTKKQQEIYRKWREQRMAEVRRLAQEGRARRKKVVHKNEVTCRMDTVLTQQDSSRWQEK